MNIGSALLPIGIIPALFILYFTLGGYEEKFQDKYIFLTFLGGIGMGTLVYALEIWFLTAFQGVVLGVVDTMLLFPLFLSFFEHLAKLVVLNLPRFQKDEGVVLYGASLGLGFASVAGVIVTQQVDSLFSVEGGYRALLAVGMLLLSCATGMWLGVGVAMRRRMRYLGLATLGGMVMWPLVLYRASPYAPGIAIVYGLLVYLYTRGSIRPYLLGRQALKEAYRQPWWRRL